MTQISLTIPDEMLNTVKKRAKAEGFRNVQEYLLQALRDKWFLDNLPRYEKLAADLDKGKGYSMSIDEFKQYNALLRKGSEKEAEAFMKAHKMRK